MDRKDWRGARVLLSRVGAAEGGPAVCQALAIASFCCGEWEESRQQMEEAYAGFRVAGLLPSAVQAATFLGFMYFGLRGDVAASHGWLRRAQRLCAELGECVEEGYVELAIPACDVPNVARLERSARRALVIARRFGDQDLEMRALADLGLALVSQGRVSDGLAMLEEAMLAGVNGEVQFFSAGLIACSMLSACVRAGDAERARSWLERIDGYLGDAELTVLQSHCQIALGCVLALIGRWPDAEAELERAITSCARTSLPLRACAVGALAELRVRQGRLHEARNLLKGYEDRSETVMALAELCRAEGDYGRAVALVRRGLRELGPDAARGAELLDLLVRVQLESGDSAAASRSAARLAAIADRGDDHADLRALAAVASARTAGERSAQPVRENLEQALALLAPLERPLLAARVRLELARALVTVDPAGARVEARAALAAFERLGAIDEIERARGVLDALSLPADVRRATERPPDSELTRREREIAQLVADGLTNREIAERLVISIRTVENHVAHILMKLGLSTRTQLATIIDRGRRVVG